MNARVRRLVLGFLAGFILLSLIPAMPGLWQQAAGLDLNRVAPALAAWSDLLLGAAAGLLTLALALRIRRRVRTTKAAAFQNALAQQLPAKSRSAASVAAPRGLPAVKPFSRSPRGPQPPASELEIRLRSAARKGEKIAALARRHHLSIDAVRVALGDAAPQPAAPRGNSFRGQQRLPAGPSKAIAPRSRKPYGATA